MVKQELMIMKKYFMYFSLAALAIFSCSKEVADVDTASDSGDRLYSYTLCVNPGDATKMAVGQYNAESTPAIWESGDAIAAFKDGSNVGTVMVGEIDETGRSGMFELTTTAAPGDKIRILYPATASYGQGTLPSAYDMKSAVQNTLGMTHAYSDEITLSADGAVGFSLRHALATVRVYYRGGDDMFQKGQITYITLRSIGNALSGDYTVDYATGAVTPGENTFDYVKVQRQAGVAKGASNTAYFTTLPTEGVQNLELMLTYQEKDPSTGAVIATHDIPFKFKGELKGGKLNVFDLDALSLESVASNTDYYAKWLKGEDFQIGDLVVNKTAFPTCRLLRAADVTSAVMQSGGLVFIDDKDGIAQVTEAPTNSQLEIAKSAELVLVGRYKDAGTQPDVRITEMRVNNNDASFLNVKLTSLRKLASGSTDGGCMFGKQNAASSDTRVRMVDCYVDARSPQRLVDLYPSGSTSNKVFSSFYVDNCIVDLPKRTGDEAGTVVSCSMIYHGKTNDASGSEKTVTVRNSVLFSSTPVVLSAMKVFLFDSYSKALTLARTEITFENNTIANIQNNTGLCAFKNSSLKALRFNGNLSFNEGAAETANETIMTRNEGTNTVATVELNDNFCARLVPAGGTARAQRVTHSTNSFVLGTGNMDTGTAAAKVSVDPFSAKDYSCGHFVVDESKVTNGAGARTEKKFITPSM